MKKISFLLLCSLIAIFCVIALSSTIVLAESAPMTQVEEIESTKYIVNNEDKIVYRVMPETDVSSFKANFKNPEIIKVYTAEDGEEVADESIIGTGMILENTTNNEKYEISVIADLDGDGLISSVELTKEIRHVVGLADYQLEGIYEKSADLNNDNSVNHIDITILIRYIVYGELEVQENEEIKSPEIELVSGETGLDGWYISNVQFKVVQDPENGENIKTRYKILGSETSEEIEANSDDVITLEDGVYQIIAYSYSNDGHKSFVTRAEFKVDATAPILGNLNMWLEEENGQVYENGTWTNQSVVISQVDGSDETSGHAKTSYYIKDSEEITEGTQGVNTLTENGTYVVVLTTEDNAGNRSEKEFTIKIDKTNIIPPELKVVSGDQNEGSEWYYSDVVLQLEEQQQDSNSSKIIKNTYEIEGAQATAETEIENNGQITIIENGISIIKVYSYNEAGNKSKETTLTIKKDSSRPAAPKINVISGTNLKNNWYIDDVKLQVIKVEADENLSQINRMAYKIEGATETALTDINNEDTIDITNDGTSTISVYSYNEAGNRSEATEIIISKDSVNPENVEVSYENLKSDSYTLVLKGTDSISGMESYDIYIDGILKDTIKSSKEEERYDVKDQKSGTYSVYIIGKDKAGRFTKSETIEIKMAKIEKERVDHIEFVVNNFHISDDENRISKNGVSKLISDTSLTAQSKYIMLTSDQKDKNNLTGTLEGKVRIILTDGTVLEDTEFFPEDLNIDMEYYTNGSGRNFEHTSEANFFGNNLNPEKVEDKITVNTTIGASSIIGNNFTITEKKLNGVSTYVRVKIQSITLGEQAINFQIIDK